MLSPYIIVIPIAWVIAHVVKYIIASVSGRRLDFTHQLFISGGMPSSHAATSIAVWTIVLLKDGPNSGLFGLATLCALIICYDAVKVRRSVGEQGEAIQRVIKKQNLDIKLPRAARGHTPIEVLAGCLLGVIVGTVVFIATR